MSENQKMQKQIVKVYEAFNGSIWYLLDFMYEQADEFSEHDKIYFGYACLSGMEDLAEFGNIAEAELLSLGPKIWLVPKSNWPICRHFDKIKDYLGS